MRSADVEPTRSIGGRTGGDRRTAYLAAYDLWEAVQSEDHAGAAAQLPLAAERAEQADWSEVGFVLAAAEIVHLIMRPSGAAPPAEGVEALLLRAEARAAGVHGDGARAARGRGIGHR